MLAGVLAACSQSQNANYTPPTNTGPTAIPQPGQVSSSINPASGGTISAPFANGTAQLTIPAGAIAGTNGAPVTVTLTAYSVGSQMGVTFQNIARKAQSVGRTTQGVPAGSQFIVGFSVVLSSGYLVAPLQVSLPTVNPPLSSQTVQRLAMYNPAPTGTANPSFFDVDTATINGNGAVITNDVNPKYVSISSTNGGQPYAFYSAPAANIATPAPITLSATSVPAGPYYLVNGSSATFTATGADANGNPLAYIPTFSLSSATLGTIAPGAGPYNTVFTSGTALTSGTLNISDPRTKATGTAQIIVTNQRPANTGASYTYAGNLGQTTVRFYPSPNPADVTNNFYPSPYPTGVTVNTAATSGQVVTVTAQASPGVYDFHTVDTESYTLEQAITTTDNYYKFPTSGLGGIVSLLQTNSYNAASATDAYAYNISQMFTGTYQIDSLPEQAGATWTNGSAYTYAETDPNGEKTTGTWNADGSYNETTVYPTFTSAPAPGATPVTGVITVNSNGTGTYNVPYAVVVSGLPANTVLSFGTPAPNPAGTPYIPVNVVYYNGAKYATQAVVWYPTGTPMYTETDTNTGTQTLPSSCNVPSAYGSSANALVQKIQRIDPVIGYTDVQTNTSYQALGLGTLCVTLSDVNTEWYDYSAISGDQAPFRPRRLFFANTGTPISVITTTQVLGLASTNQPASVARSAQSVALSAYQIKVAKAAFEHQLASLRHQRKEAMAQAVSKMLRSPGGP